MDWRIFLRRWAELARVRNSSTELRTPLTFIAAQASSSVEFRAVGTVSVSLEYSTDRSTWTAYTPGTVVALANVGDSVSFRGNNSQMGIDADNYMRFYFTGQVKAFGNIMSLLDKTCQSRTLTKSYAFYGMFMSCSQLLTLPLFPATTLTLSCYRATCQGCSSIVRMPELPFTEAKGNCCRQMFRNCISLQEAKLNITSLQGASNALQAMFDGCSSLTSVRVAFTAWNDSGNSTSNWLRDVAASGTFYCPVDGNGYSLLDTSTRDASHVPSGWTAPPMEPVSATGSVQFTNTANYHDTTITINGVTKSEVNNVILFEALPVGTYNVSYTGYDVQGIPSTVTITANHIEEIEFENMCLLEGTMIRLANGTNKPIEDITYDDELLVWDFDNGCFSTAKPAWIKKEEFTDYWYEDTFANGTVLRTTGPVGHRVFNIDRNEFAYDTESVGDMVYTLNGASLLLSSEKKLGTKRFYNIITERHFNLFADGVLTSCRLSNMYPISGFRYVKPETQRATHSTLPPEIIAAYRLSEQPENLDGYISRIIEHAKEVVPMRE